MTTIDNTADNRNSGTGAWCSVAQSYMKKLKSGTRGAPKEQSDQDAEKPTGYGKHCSFSFYIAVKTATEHKNKILIKMAKTHYSVFLY